MISDWADDELMISDQVNYELIISDQVEGMEEDEQDQEVPEAPSPVDDDDAENEAGNEQEVGGNLSSKVFLNLLSSGAHEYS